MSSYIIVREKGKNIPVKAKKILRIEGDGNYVNIYLKNGKVFKNQVGSIRLWNDRLKKSGRFIKVNRSHLVNYKRVASFSSAGGVVLHLCTVREYLSLLLQSESPAKDEAIAKNTLRLHLSPDGFTGLMFRFLHDFPQQSAEDETQSPLAV